MPLPVANGDNLPLPAGLPPLPPVQDAPREDEVRGYVRMAVMDGKTIGHRVSTASYSRNRLYSQRP